MGSHTFIEAFALIVLLICGLIAVAAGMVLRNRAPKRASTSPGRTLSSGDSIGRLAWLAIASASVGAGIIHLALGPSHLDEIGVLGLGFFVVGAAQLIWAAVATRRPGHRLAWLGIGGNVAVLAAWAFTRTVGLPVGPDAWTPEGIGRADSVAGLFELLVIAVLLVDVSGLQARGLWLRTAVGTVAAIGLVPIVGSIMVLTTLALASGEPGHHHMTTRTTPRMSHRTRT